MEATPPRQVVLARMEAATTAEGADAAKDAPSHASLAFTLGSIVFVKRYGRATVVSSVQSDPLQPFHNRLQVQYPDGKTYWARPATLRPIITPKSRIVAAETTKQYREAAMRFVAPDDTVLEVGCHEGVTTAMLHQRCQLVVGVDMSELTVNMARSKWPHCRFETIDGFDVTALKALCPSGTFDKILIDIGGIAELPTVMQLVGLYYKEWPTSIIVVKSVFFARLLQDAEMYVPSGACLSSAAEGAAEQRQRTRKRQAEQRHSRPVSEALMPKEE